MASCPPSLASSSSSSRVVASRGARSRRAVAAAADAATTSSRSTPSKRSSKQSSPSLPLPAPSHASHRAKVLDALPANKLVHVPAGREQTRNGVEGHARFRQEPSFLYLTGVEDPGYHALLRRDDDGGDGGDATTTPSRDRFVLVAPRRDVEHEVWCGAQPSAEALRARTGADAVFYDDEWSDALAAMGAREGETIFRPGHDLARDVVDDSSKATNNREASHQTHNSLLASLRVDRTALDRVLARARHVKTEDEIDCLRRANAVSGDAHAEVMRAAAIAAKSARGGVHEYELEAAFQAHCMREGLLHLGYPSIVGGGRNAATLHYERNDAFVAPRELILIDAGAEWRGYTADITRTFPVGGVFDAIRKDVYEAVLDVQCAAIDACRAGINWRAIGESAKVRTAQRLIDLGVIKRDRTAESAVAAGVVSLFLPHSLGHLLGLQVHDVGPGGPVPETLLEGQVVTCEPGIYFVDGLLGPAMEDATTREFLDADVVATFRPVGGVRIEDNLVVTSDGVDNLTTCPKTVKDIEDIMRSV